MSLVLELQKEALDQSVSVSHLLRKALVVARKLKLSKFQNWIEIELNGYGDTLTEPEYRKVRGSCMVKNPYHGFQPVQFPKEEWAKKFSERKISSPVTKLESLVSNQKSNIKLTMRYPAEIECQLTFNFID